MLKKLRGTVDQIPAAPDRTQCSGLMIIAGGYFDQLSDHQLLKESRVPWSFLQLHVAKFFYFLLILGS